MVRPESSICDEPSVSNARLIQLDFWSRSTLFPETILPHPRVRPLLGGKLQQWRREQRGVHPEDVRAVTDIVRGWMQKIDFSILSGILLLHSVILKVALILLNYWSMLRVSGYSLPPYSAVRAAGWMSACFNTESFSSPVFFFSLFFFQSEIAWGRASASWWG